MTAADSPVGSVGRVTSRVRAGWVGEVIVPYHGSRTAFFAYPADPARVFDKNAVVIIVSYDSSRRSVTVTSDDWIVEHCESLAPPPV